MYPQLLQTSVLSGARLLLRTCPFIFAPPTTILTSPFSSRSQIIVEDNILKALSKVSDPSSPENRSIRALNYIKNIDHPSSSSSSVPNVITVNLHLPSRFHPFRRQIIDDANDAVRSDLNEHLVASGDSVDVKVTYDPPKNNKSPTEKEGASTPSNHHHLKGPALASTLSTIAIYSCKGGVGKSTVSTNLAYTLSSPPFNLRVGLLDCDVYGPSLPTLIEPLDKTVYRSEIGPGMILPIVHNNVKVMSLGYVSPSSGVPGSGDAATSYSKPAAPAVIRGPMASKVVTQLCKGTEWGDLDVLLLDLPPGTGDVNLTVCQELLVDGAVAVTTPGSLAKADVVKGVEMFRKLNVPTIAAVENMAYFVNPIDGKTRHYLFGKRVDYEDELGLGGSGEGTLSTGVVSIPISEKVSSGNDAKMPIMMQKACDSESESERRTEGEEPTAYRQLAKTVVAQLYKLHTTGSLTDIDPTSADESTPITAKLEGNGDNDSEVIDINSIDFKFDDKRKGFVLRIFKKTGAVEVLVDPATLRRTDPKKGGVLEKVRQVDIDRMLPVQVCERKGHYGFTVTWGNGGTVIYGLDAIVGLLGVDKPKLAIS